MKILVYVIRDYAENGGGIHFEKEGRDFEDIDERVNELAKQYEDEFEILCAGNLHNEYKYEPVEKVVKYERK